VRTGERWLGGCLVLVAVAVGVTARTFDVGFLVDPLGPKALPYLVAGLFLVGGVVLLVFPAKREGPEYGAAGAGSTPGRARGPQALSLLILVGYASALPILGFVLSTSLATGALSRMFSGRFLQGVAVGLALGLGLFGLFTLSFGMELPLGILFGGDL
jgi:putative tricarboxylic transport membrane protein